MEEPVDPPRRNPAGTPRSSSSRGVRNAKRSGQVRYADPSGTWHYVTSRSPKMKTAEQRAIRIAPADETVLILGETGVGKDLLARLIHENSSRAHGPFVHINCAALPEGLLETELFGHMRGSYTGATDSRPGQFEIASGGTLFLDEIGEMPARLQAKLLHVLQERKIYRVGGRQVLNVDVRVLAATNRDLSQDIRSGAFRRDLFYRLGVVTLRVPPLRERPEDLDDLSLHFFEKYSDLYNRPDLALPDEASLRALHNSPWPGNIRELQNVIKRIILLGGMEHLEEEMAASLSSHVGEPVGDAVAVSVAEPSPPLSLKEVTRRAVEKAERQAILESLERTSWNRKQTAQELGMSYRSLLYKLKEYTLRPSPRSD